MNEWKQTQERLRLGLVIPTVDSLSETIKTCPYVIGMDISFIKGNDKLAVCTAVLLNYHDPGTLIDTETMEVHLINPYQAGYLAFRELDSYILVFQNLMARHMDLFDKIGFVMLDGNGILHPNGLGLASHFGVVTGFRTIGCGKNLHQFDGMNRKELRVQMDTLKVDVYVLCGQSQNQTYGWAVRHPGVLNPVYISPGHLVSMRDSLDFVRPLMIHREPEPTRQADRLSREYIRNHLTNT